MPESCPRLVNGVKYKVSTLRICEVWERRRGGMRFFGVSAQGSQCRHACESMHRSERDCVQSVGMVLVPFILRRIYG